MSPKLFTLYGPLAIQSYGAAIALGLVTFLWCIRRDSRLSALVNPDTFNNIVAAGIIAGIVGGRLLYVISEWGELTFWQAFIPWIGGFSILGTVIALGVTIPAYLYRINVPILPFLDLAALYAPLLQSIARIGCFFAGCCYGQTTSLPWAITYINQDSIAPCFAPLHPTQLYSSFALFCVFLFLYVIVQKKYSKPGQLMCCYLVGIGLERFIVDFWRADRIFSSVSFFQILSVHQWIAGGIVIGACIFLTYLSREPKRNQIRQK